MLSIRTILHPTDFSECSDYAFWLACTVARDHAARLVVLHVLPPPVVVPGVGIVPADLAKFRGEAEAQLRQLQERHPQVAVECRLAEGNAADEILRTARELNCDLIVTGTHGRTGLQRVLLGSVAEQILRRAPCPVLTAKPFPLMETAGNPSR